MSFAEELHTLYKVKKAEQIENRDVIQARREKDIRVFFEKELKDGAKDKMKARAEAGRPTANVLEYQYNERFYIDDEGKVVRYADKEVNYPNYRIHDVVMRDTVFQKLLQDYEAEISSEENKIRLTRWRPRETLYVVEAVWGKNRYHSTNRFQREPRVIVRAEGLQPYRGPQAYPPRPPTGRSPYSKQAHQ